jgi:sugar/nucleoside kinase (ribokinase family)
VVALKLGGAGCVLAVPGQAPVRVAAHPARARDTTGAGDAFCGAFMSRWLKGAPDPHAADPQLADLTSAAEFAVRVAASVITRFGARPTAPQ